MLKMHIPACAALANTGDIMTRQKPLYTALLSLGLLAACGGLEDETSNETTNASVQACAADCWTGCNQFSSCNLGASCDAACDDGDAECRGICYAGLSSQDRERFDKAFTCVGGCYPTGSCDACSADCLADPDCRLLSTCLYTCKDSNCEAACMQKYPDGVSLVTRVKQCAVERGCE